MVEREGPIEWPGLERYSDQPLFNTKAVVQRTGIPAATLRAWERRYAFILPKRADNTYRLYSERDIVLIQWLKARIDAGLSISHAVSLFKHLNDAHQRQTEAQQNPIQTSKGLIDSPAIFEITVSSSLPSPATSTPPLQSEDRKILPNEDSILIAQGRLIEAFSDLDEPAVNTIMASMLALHPVEYVCTRLIVPTMWRIGKLWEQGQITIAEEHFASNYYRLLLTNFLRSVSGPFKGPLAIVCCAPGDPHELAALMLAFFLRRRDIRVLYLGQGCEILGLLYTINKLSPILVCISLTTLSHLPTLIELAQQIQNLPARPLFVFGGQAFLQSKSIIDQIPGVYLEGDMQEIADRLYSMIQQTSQAPQNKN